MGNQRGQMKGVLPWLVRWSRPAGTIDFCPALAALVSPVQNIIFLTPHFFTIFVPITQQPGQAGCLCVSVLGSIRSTPRARVADPDPYFAVLTSFDIKLTFLTNFCQRIRLPGGG
jgi:hypothetical protein